MPNGVAQIPPGIIPVSEGAARYFVQVVDAALTKLVHEGFPFEGLLGGFASESYQTYCGLTQFSKNRWVSPFNFTIGERQYVPQPGPAPIYRLNPPVGATRLAPDIHTPYPYAPYVGGVAPGTGQTPRAGHPYAGGPVIRPIPRPPYAPGTGPGIHMAYPYDGEPAPDSIKIYDAGDGIYLTCYTRVSPEAEPVMAYAYYPKNANAVSYPENYMGLTPIQKSLYGTPPYGTANNKSGDPIIDALRKLTVGKYDKQA